MPGRGTRTLCWWCDRWVKLQDWLWSVRGYTLCSDSDRCYKTHRAELHSTNGKWPKANCKSNREFVKAKKWDILEWQVFTWSQASFSGIKYKTQSIDTHTQAAAKGSCKKGPASQAKKDSISWCPWVPDFRLQRIKQVGNPCICTYIRIKLNPLWLCKVV